MVEKSNFTKVEIWRHINYLRFKRFKWAPDAHQEECISCNVEKLSHLLGMRKISDTVNEDLSKSTTKSLVAMFFTLTEPPSYFERLYNKTIYGPQLRQILLASNIFGSDRSPRRGDLVRACVIFLKITVKMSSSSILKSPRRF